MKNRVLVLCACFVCLTLFALCCEDRPAPPPPAAQPEQTKPTPPAAKQTQKEQQAERLGRELRNGARATLEQRLLSAGYDVHVMFLGTEGGDNRSLLIMGEPVNRVFIHQFIGPGLRRSLQRDGFTKVTFMKSQSDWVGEYDVATNTITDSQ